MAKVAAWKKVQDEKAKRVVAQLPEAIKYAAEERADHLIVRVEVSLPFLSLESDAYKEFETRWADENLLKPGTHVSMHNSRRLPRGCRPIARWALRQGFEVQVMRWEEDDERETKLFWRTAILNIDWFSSHVIPNSRWGSHPIREGLCITW